MLVLLRNKSEQVEAQKRLAARVKSFLSKSEIRTVTWRPSAEELRIAHNKSVYFASVKRQDPSLGERYWNVFGLFQLTGHLRITVEINIAPDDPSARIAGFFARDTNSGKVFLMHSGKIGGGAPGVGKGTFLDWALEDICEVPDEAGKRSRTGIVVAPADGPETGPAIARFILRVAQFKELVDAGYLKSPEYEQAKKENDAYHREHSGRKTGRRNAEIDYVTRHGDVVHALRAMRISRKAPGEMIPNSRLIDLYVKDGGKLTEIYEVKTNTSRQSLYCAIGQLLVHREQNSNVKLHVVLPRNEPIPRDVVRALDELKVKKIDFTLRPLSVDVHSW